MNDKFAPRFFLGANSSRGFVSFFGNAMTDPEISTKYIFKGGPGCGKSTAMRKISQTALVENASPEFIHCSSDPRSLDAVILRKKNCALFDGTAPHSLDLSFPSADGDYIIPKSFIDQQDLAQKLPELRGVNSKISAHYAEVFQITAAAGKLLENIKSRVDIIAETDKLTRRANGIIARELPKKKGIGREHKRFLSGITPDGPICFYDTARALSTKIFALTDSFGFASALLERIEHAALARGYDVFACYSPLLPTMLEHIIIPELSISFISCSKNQTLSFIPYRKINIDNIVPAEDYRQIRPQIRLMQKIYQSLILDACSILRETKLLHDELERLYLPHLDFASLTEQTQKLSCTIFN